MTIGVSQQTISNIENSETVEDDKLQLIAKELGITAEAIKNFSEEAVFNIISNTFTDNSSNNNNYMCPFNPIDKVIELYESLFRLKGISGRSKTNIKNAPQIRSIFCFLWKKVQFILQ